MAYERIAVVGDLHFEDADAPTFEIARKQLVQQRPDAVFQLGDQGGYSHCGTWQSFEEGRDFLEGFKRPTYTLIGNHDLEGPEYDTDDEAVAAWCQAFGATLPYRTVDLGEALAICLSTTRFRGNPYSCHEVHLDREQIAWFRETLATNRDRPTFVFSHAPVVGTGLRVLQTVHLRVPNAWLNHRDEARQFLDIIRENPQIKLWFSAHDHMGQDYADSIAQLGNCVAVHTGVIGPVSRDQCRQSRFVEFDASGWTLSSVNHGTGTKYADARHEYATGVTERLVECRPGDESKHFAPPPMPTDAKRVQIDSTVFAVPRGMVVEFDAEIAAPIGVVCTDLTDPVLSVHGVALHVADGDNAVQVFTPDKQHRYGAIYAPNTWRAKLRSA
jgi:hypothetical protein